MVSWERIGDNEIIPIGRRTLRFFRSDTGEQYEIVVDGSDLENLFVRLGNYDTRVIVQNKQVSSEGVYSIEGEIEDHESRILNSKGNWCELVLYPVAVVSYWGCAVLIRSDIEVA